MPRVFLTGRSCCFAALDVGDCVAIWISRPFFPSTQIPNPTPVNYLSLRDRPVVVQRRSIVSDPRTVKNPHGSVRTMWFTTWVCPPSLTQYLFFSAFIFCLFFSWYYLSLFCFDYLHGSFDLMCLCLFWLVRLVVSIDVTAFMVQP